MQWYTHTGGVKIRPVLHSLSFSTTHSPSFSLYYVSMTDINAQLCDVGGSLFILMEHATANRSDCFTVSVHCNRTLSSLQGDLSINSSLAGANCSPVFLYLHREESRNEQLSPSSLPYQAPPSTLAHSGHVWVSLHIKLLQYNGPHLHLSSPLLKMPAHNFTSEFPCTYIRTYVHCHIYFC